MTRWFSRAGMTSAFVANGLSFGAWAGSLPRLREAAGLSDSQLGLVLLAAAAGAACAMPVAGALAARFGSGRVTIATGLSLAMVLALPAVMPGWITLLLAAAAFGMLSGSMDVAMNARGAEIELGWGSPIMSSLHAGWSFGGFAGAALCGGLASAGVSLPLTMIAAAFGVGSLTLPGVLVRETGRVAGGAVSGFQLPTRALAAFSALALLALVSEGTIADWNGVYLRTVLGVSPARASSGFAAFAGAMVVARLLGDAAVRRLGPALVVRLGSILAALGLLLALAVPDPTAAIAGFALVGVGLSNVAPVIFGAAGRRAGAPGVAMAATIGYAGQLGAPPLIGFLADAVGLRLALCLLFLSLAGSIAMAPALAPPRRAPAAAA